MTFSDAEGHVGYFKDFWNSAFSKNSMFAEGIAFLCSI